MANPTDPPPAVLINRRAILCNWLFSCLWLVIFGLEIFSLFQPNPYENELEAAFVLIAAAGTLAALWRQLPLQNVLLAAGGIAAIGGGFSALGARTALPFGPFIFAPALGPLIWQTLPWAMPLIWVVILLNSRGVARLILRPWRKTKNYGFRLIGLGAVLVLLFDIAFDPYASRVKNYWHWLPTGFPVTWQGASLMNFVAWTVIAVLILFLATPALIVKKPRPRTGPDYHPLCVWLGGILLFGIGCGTKGYWTPVVVDGVIGTVVTIFAIRGAMW